MSAVVQGQVVEKWSNRPVAGATVTVDGHIATTDAGGRFRLTLPAGNYTIQVVHKDYAAGRQAFTARTGSVQIVLEPIFRALRRWQRHSRSSRRSRPPS